MLGCRLAGAHASQVSRPKRCASASYPLSEIVTDIGSSITRDLQFLDLLLSPLCPRIWVPVCCAPGSRVSPGRNYSPSIGRSAARPPTAQPAPPAPLLPAPSTISCWTEVPTKSCWLALQHEAGSGGGSGFSVAPIPSAIGIKSRAACSMSSSVFHVLRWIAEPPVHRTRDDSREE